MPNPINHPIRVITCSRDGLKPLLAELPQPVAVISISDVEKLAPNCLPETALTLFFDQSEHSTGISESDAECIAHFVKKNAQDGHMTFVIQSESGKSRAAGVATAILRACGQDISPILDGGHCRMNGRCYYFACRALGINITEQEAEEARQRSQIANAKMLLATGAKRAKAS